MIKKLKVVDFLKAIPYDNICHANCRVTFADDERHFFAYVKLDDGSFLRTYSFKSFWSVMQALDEVALELQTRITVKTPLFRKSFIDDFTSFDIGM